MNDDGKQEPPALVELRSELTERMPPELKTAQGKKIGIIVGVVVLVLIIAGGVWAALRQRGGDAADGGGERGIFGNLPSASDRENDRISGLSGKECEHPQRRPIGVMLAGDPINRPLSGFTKADMVWELPVLVSNVTRLMAVYQCGEPTDIGSVRSARHDYLFLADGLDAILSHWGGSYHALNRIAVGEFQTLNALANPSGAFFRKDNLPRPYNGFTTYENLWRALQEKGYRTESNFAGYVFKDDVDVAERPTGGRLTVAWPGAFRVSYEYNQETNRYERYWARERQIDAEDGEVVAPSSVVIMRATNGPAEGPGGYNDVGIQGSGRIEVYQDGIMIPGTWSKSTVKFNDPVKFLNEQGEPIRFVRGQIWVMTPSDDIAVTWEPAAAEAEPAVPAVPAS